MNKFKYLGVTIGEEGGSEEAVRARVSAALGKWRDISGVISDKNMPRKLKIKLYMTVIRPVLLNGAEYWTVGKKEEQILEKTEMRMLIRIKGATLRDRVKSVDIRKELGVSSIQEKLREMRLRWYGHMQRMEENEVRAVGDIRVPGKRPRGDQEGDGWMASEGICRHCGSPRKMRRTEHSGNQEFGPLTPPSGKRRRRRSCTRGQFSGWRTFLNVQKQKLLLLNFENAVNIFENGSSQNSHNLMLYVLIGLAFIAYLNH